MNFFLYCEPGLIIQRQSPPATASFKGDGVAQNQMEMSVTELHLEPNVTAQCSYSSLYGLQALGSGGF